MGVPLDVAHGSHVDTDDSREPPPQPSLPLVLETMLIWLIIPGNMSTLNVSCSSGCGDRTKESRYVACCQLVAQPLHADKLVLVPHIYYYIGILERCEISFVAVYSIIYPHRPCDA